MQTRLIPTSYSRNSVFDYSNMERALTNIDSTTYGTVSTDDIGHPWQFLFTGFNFSKIPFNAKVSEVLIGVKANSKTENGVVRFRVDLHGQVAYYYKTIAYNSVASYYIGLPSGVTFNDIHNPDKRFGIAFNFDARKEKAIADIYGMEVVVTWEPADMFGIKKNGKWYPTTPYKKVNGVWVPQTDIRDLLNEEYIKKGD